MSSESAIGKAYDSMRVSHGKSVDWWNWQCALIDNPEIMKTLPVAGTSGDEKGLYEARLDFARTEAAYHHRTHLQYRKDLERLGVDFSSKDENEDPLLLTDKVRG